MKTTLIYGDDPELTCAWAKHLSEDGYVVFTSSDSLEASDILRTIDIDSVIIATNDPGTYLILGRTLRARRKPVNTVVITRLRRSDLELLLETTRFTELDGAFTFDALRDAVNFGHKKTEELQDADF